MLKRSVKRRIAGTLGRICISILMLLVSTALPKVSNSHEAVVDDFVRLDQNYPNPFNVSTTLFTTITYSIPEAGHVSMNLYNLLGEQMETLVEKDLGRNEYTYRLDAGNLPSGQYTYRLVFTGSSAVAKVSRKLYLIR